MNFQRIDPISSDKKLVECYWTVHDDSTTPIQQKIIPDGFPEIIFHFGDHYRINLANRWSRQAKSLFAGQIHGHFFLENSGQVEMLGIKLKPSAPTHLFDIPMQRFVDRVVPLRNAFGNSAARLDKDLRAITNMDDRIDYATKYFSTKGSHVDLDQPIDRAINIVFEKKGMITVAAICSELSVGERHVEQLFKKYVGLSPKFFTRIIRFNYIFQLIKDKDPDWSDVVYEAGYYDQSHFIRNFKSFTGEDPTAYMFAEKNLANFFLKK